MLNVKKIIAALVFAMSVAPLAANAKGADMLCHHQAQYVMLTSATNQTVSRFSEGRAAGRMSAQPDATAFLAASQSDVANINSSRTANTGS